MNSKLKLTPKDCLYIDDALTQMSAISMRIAHEVKEVQDEDVKTFLNDVNKEFCTQYEAIKNMLKEASA